MITPQYISDVKQILEAGLHASSQWLAVGKNLEAMKSINECLIDCLYWVDIECPPKARGKQQISGLLDDECAALFKKAEQEFNRLAQFFPEFKSSSFLNYINVKSRFDDGSSRIVSVSYSSSFDLTEAKEKIDLSKEIIAGIVESLEESSGTYQMIDDVKYELNSSSDNANQKYIQLKSGLIDELVKLQSGEINFKTCRKHLNQIFNNNQFEKDSPQIKLYDALVCLFKSFFNLLDHLISTATGSPDLMADSGTPLAKTITGRRNFFNYYQGPTSYKLMKSLDESMEHLANLEALQGNRNAPA